MASLEGFSNKHSRWVFRQRLHGGLSAPSHLIFCFLQAFYPTDYEENNQNNEKLTQAPGMQLVHAFSTVCIAARRQLTGNPVQCFYHWFDISLFALIVFFLLFDGWATTACIHHTCFLRFDVVGYEDREGDEREGERLRGTGRFEPRDKTN